MTVIVVDTNILRDCPRLDNSTWTSILEHTQDWGVRIVVPEVVFMESLKQVRLLWQGDRDRLAALRLGHFRLTDTQASMVAAIDRQSDEYEEWLIARFKELCIEIQPVPPVDAMEIARRSSAGRAPFIRNEKGKTKDGYRDTLIWLTLLTVAADNPDDEVWLISENHSDFGPTPPHWTGHGTGRRDDCPIQFHNDLLDDLAAEGLQDRVHYVVRADLLEQHLASLFAPIPETELADLVSKISMAALASTLMYQVLGRKVDPSTAALPVGAVAGQVVVVHEQHDGWKFAEAARRGSDGWTARFEVDSNVGIELVGEPWLADQITKVLRVSGRVVFSAGGEVIEMTVGSAEALPEDPERPQGGGHVERSGRTPPMTQEQRKELAEHMIDRLSDIDVIESLREQNAELMKDIASKMIGPNIGEMLREQNAELMKDIASKMIGPNIGEMLREQNAELMKDIASKWVLPNASDAEAAESSEQSADDDDDDDGTDSEK